MALITTSHPVKPGSTPSLSVRTRQTLFSNQTLEVLRLARKIHLPTNWTIIGNPSEQDISSATSPAGKRAPFPYSNINFTPRLLEDGQKGLFCILEDGRDKAIEVGINMNWGLNNGGREVDINKVWRLACELMWMMLGKIGIHETNPFEIPAAELRIFVWPHHARARKGPRNWKPIIERALTLLTHVMLYYRLVKEQADHDVYRFIAKWEYRPRGKGGHGDGIYEIQLMQRTLGILNNFKIDPPNGTSVSTINRIHFSFTKKLSLEDRWRIQGGKAGESRDSYRMQDPLLPFYFSVAGLTAPQINLFNFLDRNITLNKDPAKTPLAHLGKSGLAPKERRLYTREFCDRLPHNDGMVGALGHFPTEKNPESGFYLRTIAAICYPLPAGGIGQSHKAWTKLVLTDLEYVVGKKLGGIVMCHHSSNKNLAWLDLNDLKAWPAEKVWGSILIFCFLPTTYLETLRSTWQNIVGPDGLADKMEADEALRLEIASALKRSGMKKRELAAHLGIQPSTLTYWLTHPDPNGNKRSTPIPEEAIPKIRKWLATLSLRAA